MTPDELPPDAGLDEYAARYGLLELFALICVRVVRAYGVSAAVERVCQIAGIPQPWPRSMATIVKIAQRHRRMAELLATDPDLVQRREKLGEGGRLLSEAARRAIKENAQPSELDPDGEPLPDPVKKLVGSFPYLMFDDPRRGQDKGLWFS